MNLPRVLVLDDLTFWSQQARRWLCEELGLAEAGDGIDKGTVIAEAVFANAQRRDGNVVVNDVDEAVRAVETGWPNVDGRRWSLVLLDLQFDYGKVGEGPVNPDSNPAPEADPVFGLEILSALRERFRDPESADYTAVPVVALSRTQREDTETALMSIGCRGFLERDSNRESLRNQLVELLLLHGLVEDGPWPRVASNGDIEWVPREAHLLGRSESHLRALRAARVAARYEKTCLLLGPTGSGKELLARYIHEMSPRRTKAYDALNCAAIPDELLESELFGIKKGVATGVEARPGKFEVLDRGTLFLDEIGDLSGSAQAKVLRVLENGELRRVGDSGAARTVDVHVVSATNRNLQEEIEQGRFREDLYYRLSDVVVRAPGLGERGDDIDLLFRTFLEDETRQCNGVKKEIDVEVGRILRSRDWPGNVRELERLARSIAVRRRLSVPIVSADLRVVDGDKVRTRGQSRGAAVSESESTSSEEPRVAAQELVDLPAIMEQAAIRPELLEGALASLESSYARLVGRLLSAALERTRNISGGQRSPDLGKLSPTRAVKLLMGERTLSTSQAADRFKQFAKLSKEAFESDSDLARACDWALKLRRKRSRRKKSQRSKD